MTVPWLSLYPHQRGISILFGSKTVRLHHKETLYYYDGPVMATMCSPDGRLFLATAVDCDDRGTNPIMVFAAVEISERRLRHVRNNNTTLREAFRFPEYGPSFYLDADEPMGTNQWYVAVEHPMEPAHFATGGARLRFRQPGYRYRKGRLQRINKVGRRRPRK